MTDRLSSKALLTIFALTLIVIAPQSCSTIHSMGRTSKARADAFAVKHPGLFSNYGMLPPVPEGQFKMTYIAPDVDWRNYDKVIVAPLTCVSGQTDKMSRQDLQTICNYTDSILRDHLAKRFTLVQQPGRDVMTLRAALIDTRSAGHEMRTSASVGSVGRRDHLLDEVEKLPMAGCAFAGSADGQAEVVNSLTGRRMAAWKDQRASGSSMTKAVRWRWGDAESALDFWTNRLTARLVYLHAGKIKPDAGKTTPSSTLGRVR